MIFGDGEQSRDFTYVDNAVQGNLLAMDLEHVHGEAINIACGRGTSVNQLFDILKDITGSKVLPTHREPRKGDVRHSLADIRKAEQILKYRPKVEIEAGLELTVNYFQKR